MLLKTCRHTTITYKKSLQKSNANAGIFTVKNFALIQAKHTNTYSTSSTNTQIILSEMKLRCHFSGMCSFR